MTREETKEIISVMQHYVDGGEIDALSEEEFKKDYEPIKEASKLD